MSAQKIKLGSKIRQLRRERQLSLISMAEKTSIAQSTLSKIENDIISPGFDKVMKICSALKVDITDLINGEKTAPITALQPAARISITRRGETTSVTTENYISNFVCSNISKKVMIPLLVQLLLKDGEENTKELIRHPGEEFSYVLRGRMKVILEHYEPSYLEEGDSIYFDSTMGHLYLNASEGDTFVLSVSLSSSNQ